MYGSIRYPRRAHYHSRILSLAGIYPSISIILFPREYEEEEEDEDGEEEKEKEEEDNNIVSKE